MIWSLCKDYIDDRVAASPYDYREFTDAFSFESNAGSVLDRSYHVGAPQITLNNRNDILFNDLVNIDLTFFYRGYADPQTKLFEVIDEVECIRRWLFDKIAIEQKGFANLEGSSIATTQLAGDNDNAFTIAMGLVFDLRIRSGSQG